MRAAAAAEEHACPGVIEGAGLVQVLHDKLEDLLEAQRHDALQVLEVDRLKRQPHVAGGS